MTSLGAATARWAYVQYNVNEAILIAGQKDVCMCAADHERSQRRSAAVAGMLRRGSVRVRERWMNVPVQQRGLQTNNADLLGFNVSRYKSKTVSDVSYS